MVRYSNKSLSITNHLFSGRDDIFFKSVSDHLVYKIYNNNNDDSNSKYLIANLY